MSCLYLFPILLALQPVLVASQFAVQSEANAAFIRYNGTVSGRYTFPSSLSSGCPDWIIPPELGSTLYVGAYPIWDKNPFFFDLWHLASGECDVVDCPFDYVNTSDVKTKRQFITFTEDSLYNLQFVTAAYECMKDNKPCSDQDSFFIEPPFEYWPIELADLTKASVERVDVDGEKGYHVQGDEKTWVGNGTITPHFDISPPDSATRGSECYDNNPGHFTWYVYSPHSSSSETASIPRPPPPKSLSAAPSDKPIL